MRVEECGISKINRLACHTAQCLANPAPSKALMNRQVAAVPRSHFVPAAKPDATRVNGGCAYHLTGLLVDGKPRDRPPIRVAQVGPLKAACIRRLVAICVVCRADEVEILVEVRLTDQDPHLWRDSKSAASPQDAA